MALQTYEMVLSARCCGQFVQNVLHYYFDDAAYPSPIAAAKGLVDGWIAAGKDQLWLDMHCESYILMSVKTRRRTGGIGPQWIDLSLQGTPGNRSGESQTSSNGPVILWLPLTPNRVTGKTFIAGVSDSDADRGELSSTCINDLKVAAEDSNLVFPTVGGGTPNAQLCIVKSGAPGTRYGIDGVEVCREIGVQRRRQTPV